jgi:uncharacterized membrane protein
MVFMVIGIILACLVAFLLYVVWLFAYHLVIDKRIGFWDAMEVSRKAVMKAPGRFFGLVLMFSLLMLLGVLACCVGIFVAAPVSIAALSYAYEDIFGSQISPT